MEHPIKVRYERVSELAHVPTRGSEKAAGYDLYAAVGSPVSIAPHETARIDTGLRFEIPDGYFAAIRRGFVPPTVPASATVITAAIISSRFTTTAK